MVCVTMGLDFPAVGEQRFFEVSPDMLDRMAMVGLQAGLRRDRFDGFSEALGSVPLMRYVTVLAIWCRWSDTPWWHAKAQEFVHGPDVVC